MTEADLAMIVRTLELHAEGALKMADLLVSLQAYVVAAGHRIVALEERLTALEAPGELVH